MNKKILIFDFYILLLMINHEINNNININLENSFIKKSFNFLYLAY